VLARRSGATIQVNGSIPITFADWNIPTRAAARPRRQTAGHSSSCSIWPTPESMPLRSRSTNRRRVNAELAEDGVGLLGPGMCAPPVRASGGTSCR
jgi:hypothetical protein